MTSSGDERPKRRFPPPWTVEPACNDGFYTRDANRVRLASVFCRNDLQNFTFGPAHLTRDEAECCAYNNVPFDRVAGIFASEQRRWCVFQFALQMDAIRFWDKFSGRWLLQNFFIAPERPRHLVPMQSPPQRPGLGAAKSDGRG